MYHEYTHSILHTNSHWLPVWLDEGLAEFYGYTRFQSDKIYIGAPTERYATLKQSSLMPVMTVLEVDRRSPYLRDQRQTQIFYADAWALVHYMIFGPGMQNGELLGKFYELVQKGVSQKEAFFQTFGDPAKFDKVWSNYLNRLGFSAGVMAPAPPLDRAVCRIRKLSVAETELELGAFHVGAHDINAAGPMIDAALRDDPKLGAAHEENAYLLFRKGKDDEALAEFTAAYTLDAALYRSLFAKTMMSPLSTSNDAAEERDYEAALKKVTELNPTYAPAFVELAMLYLRQRNYRAAFEKSKMAEKLEPSRAGYHILSGKILVAAGQGADAVPYATFVAERWFGVDHNEAVDLWNLIPPAKRPAGTSITFEQPGEQAKSITGVLQSTHCGEAKEPFTLVLSSGGKSASYSHEGGLGGGFSDTLWVGEDHYTICHHLEGKPATIYFKPSPDPQFAGQLLSLEVRDNLVVPSVPAVPNTAQKPDSTTGP